MVFSGCPSRVCDPKFKHKALSRLYPFIIITGTLQLEMFNCLPISTTTDVDGVSPNLIMSVLI